MIQTVDRLVRPTFVQVPFHASLCHLTVVQVYFIESFMTSRHSTTMTYRRFMFCFVSKHRASGLLSTNKRVHRICNLFTLVRFTTFGYDPYRNKDKIMKNVIELLYLDAATETGEHALEFLSSTGLLANYCIWKADEISNLKDITVITLQYLLL